MATYGRGIKEYLPTLSGYFDLSEWGRRAHSFRGETRKGGMGVRKINASKTLAMSRLPAKPEATRISKLHAFSSR